MWNQRKTDCFLEKFAQKISADWANWPILMQICLWESHEILPFFPWPTEAVLWTVYVIKVLHLVTFFSLSPHFFSSFTNLQSWLIVFKKSEGLNYIRSIKERTNCLVIKSLILTGHCPLGICNKACAWLSDFPYNCCTFLIFHKTYSVLFSWATRDQNNFFLFRTVNLSPVILCKGKMTVLKCQIL